MLTDYIKTAMRHATCEWLPQDRIFSCEIAELPGIWARANTEEAARAELQDVLEDWIALGLALHHPIPLIDGVGITIQVAE